MIKLNEYKNLKKTENSLKELNEIKFKLNNCIDMLKIHARHVNVMECLSILHNTRTLIEIKLDKK
jgi:hypothetical protein